MPKATNELTPAIAGQPTRRRLFSVAASLPVAAAFIGSPAGEGGRMSITRRSITRRQWLGGAGVLATAPALATVPVFAAPAAPGPDAELLACCAEADALDAKVDALVNHLLSLEGSPEWATADRLADQAYDLRERVINLPARTLEGLQAKARIVVERHGESRLALEMADSLACDVLGRAGA